MINNIIDVIETDYQTYNSFGRKPKKKVISWIKSLRPPQYCENCKLKKSVQGWKPSEEQIKFLEDRLGSYMSIGENRILKSLIGDLKKLKED